MRRSQLFALVGKIQFELPSLKTHQHAAEFVPGDFPTVDNEKRRATIAGIVRLNHSSHDPMVRDPQSKLAVLEMFSGQGATHPFDQSPEQRQQILPWITDDLEPVASRTSVAKLEGIESDPCPEQASAKVKLVDLSRAINEMYGFKVGMLESPQPVCLGHFGVEALAAKPPVSVFHRAVVDHVVAWFDLAATVATDFLASREPDWIHFR